MVEDSGAPHINTVCVMPRVRENPSTKSYTARNLTGVCSTKQKKSVRYLSTFGIPFSVDHQEHHQFLILYICKKLL